MVRIKEEQHEEHSVAATSLSALGCHEAASGCKYSLPMETIVLDVDSGPDELEGPMVADKAATRSAKMFLRSVLGMI